MSARELGNPLGNPLGLARGAPAANLPLFPSIYDFASASGASGIFRIPSGSRFFRVTVVGAGGSIQAFSGANGGGGGGGLAQSEIIPVNGRSIDINYTAPPTTAFATASASASASFLDVALLATGGAMGISNSYPAAAGGVGSGGAINTSGGKGGTLGNNGQYHGGGGAGGTASSGGDGGNGGNGSDSAGDGGGGGGGGNSSQVNFGMGGGGVASSSATYPMHGVAGKTKPTWGSPPINQSGGAWGGGAGTGSNATGGYGGVRIEVW